MTLTMITEGLLKLLEANHYNPSTIEFYQREWNKIRKFLYEEYSDEEFEMERGLAYLEKQYRFVTRYNDGTLSQQRVQLLRVVHMLEDYRLHQVLRRYHASKNPPVLKGRFADIYEEYCEYLARTDLAPHTVKHYSSTALIFLDYLSQKGIEDPVEIDLTGCNSYIKALAGFSFKTIEQKFYIKIRSQRQNHKQRPMSSTTLSRSSVDYIWIRLNQASSLSTVYRKLRLRTCS